MAGLLVAMLMVKSRVTHQLTVADRHLRGVAAADALLARWWADPPTFPVDQSGPVPSEPTLTWRTIRLPDAEPTAGRFGVRTVRLEIFDAGTPTAIAGIDLLLPKSAAAGR